MRYALVVPALNEEEAIAGTLRRALASREKVVAQTCVQEMIIVFVNDGSTDRTQEIVDQPEFKDVVKVHFKKNRGYGAAIKAGWQATDAELVGFIDGDGTCEPDFSINLINEMMAEKADVVIAARLAPDTDMPAIRKLGNRIFATLLGVVSGHTEITDTASGYRIVRREKLKYMSPLPDGLHFTPAMSCICLLDPRLKIHEVHGMHYKEREGRSKLSVVKDGLRFLYTILFSACCYSPIKTMGVTAAATVVLFALLAVLFGVLPSQSIGTAWFLGFTGLLLGMLMAGAGVIVHQLNFLLIGPRRHVGALERMLQSFMDYKRLIVGGALATAMGTLGLVAILLFLRYVLPVQTQMPLALLSILVAVGGVMAGALGVVNRVIWAVSEKQRSLIIDDYQYLGPAKASEGSKHQSLTEKLNQPVPAPQN
jgi:hypothetical protein